MPYMSARPEDIEKALYLLQFGVPFGALSYVFGRDEMFWYRLFLQFGRPSLVGTTVKAAEKLPTHLVADEKLSWVAGQKVYLPTTVAKGVFLGATVISAADAEQLTHGGDAGRLDVLEEIVVALPLFRQASPISGLNEAGPKERMTAVCQLTCRPSILLLLALRAALQHLQLHLPQGFGAAFSSLQSLVILDHQITRRRITYLPQADYLAFRSGQYQGTPQTVYAFSILYLPDTGFASREDDQPGPPQVKSGRLQGCQHAILASSTLTLIDSCERQP